MNYDLIEVNTDRCTGCRDCVSVCPSPLANIVRTLDDGRKVITIDQDKCLACGECVRACKEGGRDYNDDTDRFFKDLGDRRIVIVVHPAVRAAFGIKWQAVLRWFKQNGADGIYDGAFGADICTWSYCRQMNDGSLKKTIAPICPAIERYMELYHPESMGSVAPIHSQYSSEAVYVRDFVKKNYAVAALSPCPAMKLEFEKTAHVEYNVTLKRLKDHFKATRTEFRNISYEGVRYDFDDMSQGLLGNLQSLPDGFAKCINVNSPNTVVLNTDGADRVYKELDEFLSTEGDARPDIFAGLSCKGGCPFGIGCWEDDDVSTLEFKYIYKQTEIDARARRKVGLNGTDKQFKLFEDRINPKSLVRKYEDIPEAPTKERLKEVRDDLAAFFKEKEAAAPDAKAPAPQAPAPAPAAVPAHGAHDPAVTQGAVVIKKTTDELITTIDSLRQDVATISASNKQITSMADIIHSMLTKIHGFCDSSDIIDAQTLPSITAALEKVQTALATLEANIADNGSTTEEADTAVAKLTEYSGRITESVNSMILAIVGK